MNLLQCRRPGAAVADSRLACTGVSAHLFNEKSRSESVGSEASLWVDGSCSYFSKPLLRNDDSMVC